MVSLGIFAVFALLIIYITYYRIEKINHEKNVSSIPVRIWVNGTRGKSSVTRLIAAGLRAGNKKVIAKTTGTKPSFIIRNDFEMPVRRLGQANIKEQIGIFKMAAKEKPDAVVLECMALRPDLQWTESVKIVQPTAMVITNVRADHLDVMGPTIKDMANAFINAAAENCLVFTTETNIFKNLSQKLNKKNIKMIVSDSKNIPDAFMKDFSYIEHRENVGLALEVCSHLGVDRKIAIKGMHEATPDEGVLRKHILNLEEKTVTFVYAMAANDPDSTYLIWQNLDKNYAELDILVNCRDDRIDRSLQMADLIIERMHCDKCIFTGSATEIIKKKLNRTIDKDRILDLGNKEPKYVCQAVSRFVANNSLIFAIGNTVGYGEALVKEFLTQKR